MVTILVSTRITFLTLLENSVILYDTRITFLDEKCNSRWHEKSNSRCWHIPSKMTKYVFFSTQFKTFVNSFGGQGLGRGVWTLSLLFQRMVHLSISGTETMLRYILWRQSTLLLTKKWHKMAIYAVLSQNQLWQIWDMPDFFVFFGTPQVDPFVKFYCMFNALVRPNLKRWTGFDVLIIFGVKFWWFSFFLEPL